MPRDVWVVYRTHEDGQEESVATYEDWRQAIRRADVLGEATVDLLSTEYSHTIQCTPIYSTEGELCNPTVSLPPSAIGSINTPDWLTSRNVLGNSPGEEAGPGKISAGDTTSTPTSPTLNSPPTSATPVPREK